MRQFFYLTPLCFCACLFQGENSEKGDFTGPIELIPVSLQNLGKVDAGTPNENSIGNGIDLDTITGSVVEYFIVQNTGGTNINGVEMVSDNPNFSFHPSKISMLPPAKQLNVQQIIALKIKNGSGSAGGGYDSALKAGPNQAAVSISGSTIDKANNVQVLSEKITMKAYVKRADIKVVDSIGTIAFSSLGGGGTLSGLSPDLYSSYSVHGDSVTLANTGNVDLKVSVWRGYSFDVKTDLKIKVNENARIPVPSTIAFDGNGVTSDPARFLVARDGRTYLGFEAYFQLPTDR